MKSGIVPFFMFSVFTYKNLRPENKAQKVGKQSISTFHFSLSTLLEVYIHIGKGTVIDERAIIGIFDLDITSQSHITRKYLSEAEKRGQVINAAEDIPKSYVVTEEKGIRKLYLSQMAASTLLKRAAEKSVYKVESGK